MTSPTATREQLNAAVEKATKAMLDQGKIVAAGWAGFELLCVPASAPDTQRAEMRKAFFSGAQHLFASIMTGLEEDKEPTDTDLRRMDLIHAELEAFAEELKRSIYDA